jgi:hypothetical protein
MSNIYEVFFTSPRTHCVQQEANYVWDSNENSLSIWINILHILSEQNTHLFGVKQVAYFWAIL